MEIERKFLIHQHPLNLEQYPFDHIAQGYVSTSPVIRIRQKNDTYLLTCKSKGLMAREEFEIEISHSEFLALQNKIEHQMILKERYYIPLKDHLTLELDIFKGPLQGLMMAEVEFPSLEAAEQFKALDWFDKELTQDYRFQNNHLCQLDSLKGLPI